MESLFAEVRMDFVHDDRVSIDAWYTLDNDEEGCVLGWFNIKTKKVEWANDTSQIERVDPLVQEAIKETMAQYKTPDVNTSNTRIVGFDVNVYVRYSCADKKNIVPLDQMAPQHLYELALSDDEHCVIFDSVESFLTDLNDDCISTDNYFFYKV